jgi:hypothetical protein
LAAFDAINNHPAFEKQDVSPLFGQCCLVSEEMSSTAVNSHDFLVMRVAESSCDNV